MFRLIGEDVSASEAFTKMAKTADKSAKSMKDSFGPVPGVISLAAVGVTVASIKMASDFQSQMTLLETAGGESAKNMKTVSDGILNLAQSTGTSTEQLGEGMYTIEKAGIRGADGLKVLKAAAEGAKAENVDLATATNALTSVMMSYHMKASQAVSVQNMLVAGSGMAKTTMQEYAGSLAAVIPVASAAGIGFDQVGGAIATLTQHGTSAQEATQELANTIRSLQAPNQVAQKEMQQLGINVTDLSQHLGTRGLTGTIDLISEAIAKNMGPSGLVMLDTFKKSQSAAADAQVMFEKLPSSIQAVAREYQNGDITQSAWRKTLKGMDVDQRQLAMQFAATVNASRGFNDLLHSGQPAAQTFAGALNKVMGGATGMNTALMLGGENMAYFKRATEEVGAAGRKTGSDISTWAKTQATFKVQMDEAKQGVSVLGITIGTALLPAATKVIQTVTSWTKGLIENKPALIAVVAAVGTFAAIMMYAWTVQKLMVAWSVIMKTATVAATVAQWAYNQALTDNPIGVVVMAIAALVAGLVWFFTQTKLGQSIWKGFTQFLGDAWNWLWNSVIHPVILAISTAWNWLYNTIIKPVVALWVMEFKILEVILWLLWEGVILPVVNAIGAAFSWLWTTVIKPVVDFISAAWTWLWVTTIKPVADFIHLALIALGIEFNWLWGSVISPVVNWISGAINLLGTAFGIVFGGIGDTIRGAFNGVVGFVRGIFNEVIDVVNGVIGAINTTLAAGKAIGISVSIPKLPHFASGVQSFGGGLALVGENGPEVVNLPRGSQVFPHGQGPAGSGLTVQVTVQAGAVGNEQYLARVTTDALINALRSGSINRQEIRTALGF
jgi:TP901 family phage tail tape measure protein